MSSSSRSSSSDSSSEESYGGDYSDYGGDYGGSDYGGYSDRDAPLFDPKTETDAKEVLKNHKAFTAAFKGKKGQYRGGPIFYEHNPIADVIAYCKKEKKRFVDAQFPANADSLVGVDEHEDEKGAGKEDKLLDKDDNGEILWKRPHEFVKAAQPAVFVDGISMADMSQGGTGDCWFLAMMTSLAHSHHYTIEGLINPTGTSEWGVYSVSVFLDGARYHMLIDDKFAVSKDGTPVFVRSTAVAKNELWPLILEKALAKWCGNYVDVSGSQIKKRTVLDPEKVLKAFSGAPAYGTFNAQELKPDKCVAQINTLANEGFVMTTGCRPKDKSEGLITNHAYSILNTVVLPNGETLVRLRNPWGRKEWNGKWSDKSGEWAKVGLSPQHFKDAGAEDGVFFMNVADFQRNYRIVQFIGPGPAFYRPKDDCTHEEHKHYKHLSKSRPAGFIRDPLVGQGTRARHQAKKNISGETLTAYKLKGAEEWRAFRSNFNTDDYFKKLGITYSRTISSKELDDGEPGRS